RLRGDARHPRRRRGGAPHRDHRAHRQRLRARPRRHPRRRLRRDPAQAVPRGQHLRPARAPGGRALLPRGGRRAGRAAAGAVGRPAGQPAARVADGAGARARRGGRSPHPAHGRAHRRGGRRARRRARAHGQGVPARRAARPARARAAGGVMSGDVFIVDDNPNNLSFLAALLREAGYTVRLTNSGRRALAAVRLHPPELILLDVSMPDLDGYQVCEELKRDPATRDIPVIFLSALDDVKDKVTGFRVGGVDYVTKPFQADEVLARVASQIRAARLQQELVRRNQELARKNAELLAAWSDADVMFSTLSAVLPGTTLGDRYRLTAKIGAGGFAAVYRGVDLVDDKPVAVKVLRPYPGGEGDRQRRQFELEASSTRRLSHP